MIIWTIAGLVMWTLCVSLTLVFITGGHRVRRNRYA